MCAEPALQIPLISSMIAELVDMRHPVHDELATDVPKDALPRTRYGKKARQQARRLTSRENVPFPCIHKKEPDAFQALNVLLCMNHAAVPSWRESLAVLRFMEGSGGDSQVRMRSRS
jgi:hypothetical protein